MKKFSILFALLFLSVVSCQLSAVTHAQTMSNDSYILNEGNLNSFGGKSTGSNYSVTSTGGSLAPGVYSGTNYKVRANFSYGAVASSSSAFTFSISNSSINFGTITPGEPITRSNTLTISSPITGYQLTASENYPLKNPQGAVIANTTCDAGNCTYAVAGLWNSPLLMVLAIDVITYPHQIVPPPFHRLITTALLQVLPRVKQPKTSCQTLKQQPIHKAK